MPDEELYPANNGGYYNRNVYSEKYFQGQPNVLKFYDLPSMEKTQKASLRYNQSLDERRSHDQLKTDTETQNLIGRTYELSSSKNSESDTTYRAFGDDDTDEENYIEEGVYDDLHSVQLPRHHRAQNQYERPNFDSDSPRAASRLTSTFRHGQGAPPPPHPRADSITR